MAGRGRPAGLKRFYVYTFSDKGEVIYVGKGTGRRFKLQSVRFGCDGQILRHFESEAAAYKFEATLIAKLKPSMNKVAGLSLIHI